MHAFFARRGLAILGACLTLMLWMITTAESSAHSVFNLTPSPEPTEIPTAVPPTAIPPTAVPPTAAPPTEIPTTMPPTAIPTDTPPTAIVPTETPVGPTNTPRPTNPPPPPEEPTNTPEPTPQEIPTSTPGEIVTSTPGAPATTTPVLPTATPGDADPRLEKQVNVSGPVAQGSEVVYTLRIWATGSVSSTDVVATDQLPAGLTLVSAEATRGEVRITGNTVSVILGTVAVGEEIFVTITATLDGSPGSTITNRAVLTTSSRTDIVPNNEDDARVSILAVRAAPPPTKVPAAVSRRIPTTDAAEGIQLPLGLLVSFGLVIVGILAAVSIALVRLRRSQRS